ncbi:hypothetical protein AVEN_52603-1 [Araneus ventricosus]|uniref:CCHC-type domain-containing protein n=1 Tax=Araneus ventricosus TaxID=182803 RepID=A0A4Y2ER38_ARAVE|nr:hypothetical protein AVEN_52603-1 [Araneus ventricosus]
MPMYMVELKKNGKEEKIFDLSRFMYFTVTVENYRKPPGATQCWNCNQFKHSSANCGYTTRCLKCGQEHRTSECTIITPQDNPTCINCGVVGHIASWRGCPAFPKIKPIKGQGVNYPRTQREFISSQYKRQENISYAQQAQKFLPRPDDLHERRNNTPHPTGNGECIEQEFYGFLQGIKVTYDALKSILNLIKSVSELTKLSTTEDRINHVIKALSSVANAVTFNNNNFSYHNVKTLLNLNIIFWNANGIRNRSADIRNFVEEHSPEIFLIQETKLQYPQL